LESGKSGGEMTDLEKLTELFLAEVETKNSWGKNEIIALYKEKLIQTLFWSKRPQIKVL
jgi:hypothetical protein